MKIASFKSIAKFMNPVSPVNSMRQLWEEHRHIADEPISFRILHKRHNHSDTSVAKFLCYNTWLLRAPFNDKPIIPYRAYLIGKELSKSRYDIAALIEVFEEDDAKIIKMQSGIKNEAAGHEGDFFESGGGLYTLSQFKIIGKPNRHEFANTGGQYIIDSWAQKGVLHLEIDIGSGNIDLYSTHLIYGEWRPLVFGSQVSEEHRDRLRVLQVGELQEFIAKTHKPKNIAVVTGDFNIDAERAPLDIDPYREMKRLLSNINLGDGNRTSFYDLWSTKGGKNGGTTNSFRNCKKRYTDEFVYCNDDKGIKSGRIDYVFIEKPNKAHNFNLDTTILRRRPFPLPNLKLNDVIDMLDAVGIISHLFRYIIRELLKDTSYGKITDGMVLKDLQGIGVYKITISQLFGIDMGSLFDERTRRQTLQKIANHIDLSRLVNNFLIYKIREEGKTREEAPHLSDHVGLDAVFIASPK